MALKGLRGWGAALMGVILGDDGVDVGGIIVNEVMPRQPGVQIWHADWRHCYPH